MARPGRKDRGLLSRTNSAGKIVWFVRLSYEGKERRFGSFENKTAAREFYEKAKLEQQEGRFFPERFQRATAEPIQKILDDYLLTATGKRAIRREREFARWWGNWFKGQRTPSLQPRDVERARVALVNGLRYVKSEAGKYRDETGPGRSNATVNRYTDWLRHVCNWAIKQKRLRENAVLALQRKPEDEAPMFHYSLEQESKLIEQLNLEEVDMLRLAILTGLRQANHFALRKDQINLGLGVLAIPVTKNRKPRIVHLSEEGKDILRRQMARHLGSPWLFPGTRRSDRHLNARWWYKARFKPACDRAGIPVKEVRKLWHALRHTFGSRLAGLQYKEKAIMAAGGWTSSKAVQRYLHLHDESLKEAAERLAALKPTVTKTGMVVPQEVDIATQILETMGRPA